MAKITVQKKINAPLEIVFQTISDISQFSQAIPHITAVEFLTEQRTGVGTRFRETRLMNGKEMQTELLLSKYQENDRVRMVTQNSVTTWDTLFTLQPTDFGGEVLLELTMEARANSFLIRMINRLIIKLVKKAVENDMDCVKAYCESQ